MKDKDIKMYIYSIIVVISFILVAVGTSLAAIFFADVIGNRKNGNFEVNTAYVNAMFRNTNDINVINIEPGWSDVMTFEIVNTSKMENAVGRYSLFWEIEKNEIGAENLSYSLSAVSLKDGKVISNSSTNKVITVDYALIPDVSSSIGRGVINTGVKHEYSLKLNFIESGLNQDELRGKTFSAKIVAKGE
mgnify:FL=1